ncbi:MAG TPA: FtsW/RodA/SpoVE family cell cycle protein [Chloroflexota bacterium]|nr:FtsW/RodA/SpoVE family cell cycle protein [Chloroflexota bacterium]
MAISKRRGSVVTRRTPMPVNSQRNTVSGSPVHASRTGGDVGSGLQSRSSRTGVDAVRGLLGPTRARRLRPVRPARPSSLLRGPSEAVMATRVAIEPSTDATAALAVTARPVSETEALPLTFALPRVDMYLLSTVVCLLVLGTVFIYSASMYQSYAGIGDLSTQGNVNYYLTRQFSWLALGTIALAAGMLFDFRQLRKYTMLGVAITAGLLLLVHVPRFSHSANGATRWVQFHGISLQPSEIGKLALTIYAAHWLSSKKDDVRHSVSGLIPFGIVLGLTTLLIFKQPDLGTAAVVSAAMLGMFFVSGARLRHLVSLAALFIPVIYFVLHSGGYWQKRIEIWQAPFANQQAGGYQISRSLLAFWHGGLAGVGLGNGQLKDSIPAPQTDTIFATIGEETGLIGALIVVALFAYFAYRGIRISMLAQDMFGKLLAAGITTYLVVQALLNMLSVTNIIPFTGVPLPFISFGGSSLVVNLLAVGILLNVSRHLEPVPEERSDLTGTYFWWRNRRPHLPLPNRRSEPERRPGPSWRERRRA